MFTPEEAQKLLSLLARVRDKNVTVNSLMLQLEDALRFAAERSGGGVRRSGG